MTRNYFEKLLKEFSEDNTTNVKKRYAKRIEIQSFKTLKNDFKTQVFKYNFLESLILAQDERWRRA